MDDALLEAANGLLRLPGGAAWAWAGTRAAAVVFAIGAAAWVLARPRLRAWALPAVLAVGLSDLSVAQVLKPTFERSRPCAEAPVLLTTPPGAPRRCGSGASLPSGHAATTAALAAATLSPPLAVASAFAGVQRVVTAQHNPTDVLLGWLWGGLVGLAVRRGWARWRRPPGPAA